MDWFDNTNDKYMLWDELQIKMYETETSNVIKFCVKISARNVDMRKIQEHKK